MAESQRVALDRGVAVTAARYAATPPSAALIVLGHGAGANQSSPFMVEYATGLATRGFDVATFNFPFTERGKKLPDPQPVLEACYRSVLAHVATDPARGTLPIIIGGKSLGGRIASHVAAARDADEPTAGTWWDRLRGLVFLGYPLHPPGRPQEVRVSHLPRIAQPMLVVQGARDAFGTPDELRLFFDVLPSRCEVFAVDQANHSLEVPKRSGIVQANVTAAVLDRMAEWIRTVAVGSPGPARRATLAEPPPGPPR
jgi:hypothetical protein